MGKPRRHHRSAPAECLSASQRQQTLSLDQAGRRKPSRSSTVGITSMSCTGSATRLAAGSSFGFHISNAAVREFLIDRVSVRSPPDDPKTLPRDPTRR